MKIGLDRVDDYINGLPAIEAEEIDHGLSMIYFTASIADVTYYDYELMTEEQRQEFMQCLLYVHGATKCDIIIDHELVNLVEDIDSFAHCFIHGGLVCGRTPVRYRLQPMSLMLYDGDVVDFSYKRKKKKRLETRQKFFFEHRYEDSGELEPSLQNTVFRYAKKKGSFYYPNYSDCATSFSLSKTKAIAHRTTEPAKEGIPKIERFWNAFRSSYVRYLSEMISFDARYQMAISVANVYDSLRRQSLFEPNTPCLFYTKRRTDKFLREAQDAYDNYLNFVRWYPRWRSYPRVSRTLDPLYHRWIWSTRYRGSALGSRHRWLFGDRFIHNAAILDTHRCAYSGLLVKLDRQERYTQVIDSFFVDAPYNQRAHLQRRLIRMRRVRGIPVSRHTYYTYSCNSSYNTYRVNRFAVMEMNSTVRKESYLKWLIREARLRLTHQFRRYSPMFYTYYRRDALLNKQRRWRYNRDRRRYTLSGDRRMVPFGDHVTSTAYRAARVRKFNFLRESIVNRISRRVKMNWPVYPGFRYNAVIQRIDTRRKMDIRPPEGYALFGFLLSFVNGLSTEKAQKKTHPLTIGAYSSFNRATINLEYDLGPLPGSAYTVRFSFDKAASFARRLIKASGVERVSLKHFFWFYLFTPFWYVYYTMRILVRVLRRFFRWSILNAYDGARGNLRVMRGILRMLLIHPIRNLQRRLLRSRFVRVMTWVYTSWLYVDAFNNDYYGQQNPNYETEDDAVLEEEVDYNFDNINDEDEDDSTIGMDDADYNYSISPFMFGNPIYEWYVNNVPDDELNELYEESSYFVRLVIRPVLDACIRLPLWSFLELISLLTLATKKEYQRLWYILLTYGNVSGCVRGRWWKVPLVLLKCLIRFTLWVVFTVWMVSLISSDDLKIIVTYTLNSNWFEEYYYLYVAVTVVMSTLLVGPVSVRSFIIRDLGAEGTAFVFFAPVAVSAPQGYHPQRPMFDVSKDFAIMSVTYADREWTVQDQPFSGRMEYNTVPGTISYDNIRVVIDKMGYFGRSYSEDTEDRYYMFPHHVNHKEERAYYNFSKGHPHRGYNDWYRRDIQKWDSRWVYPHLFPKELPYESDRYTTSDSADFYWNRTIVNRTAYPTIHETIGQPHR